MTDNAVHLVLERASAGHTLAEELAPACKHWWDAGHARIAVIAKPEEDDRSLRQNAFYWAYVLKTISEQAQDGGMGALPDGWNLFYKRLLLGYRITKVKVPGKKRPSVMRTLRSTKDLSVTKMSRYLEEVMAHAATTFGVRFPAEKKWEEWRP